MSNSHAPSERMEVLKEIVQSEQQYTAFLQALYDVFQIPLLEKPEFISHTEHTFIFSNLQPIREAHVGLLHDLEEHHQQVQSCEQIRYNLGEIFLKHVPSFKVYVEYCNQFTAIATLLRELKEKNKLFDKWLKSQKKQPQTQGNAMDSLLIMPVQRLPRYSLLLSQILSKTSDGHRDFSDLVKAIEVIKQMNEFVNQKILDYNNKKKMESLAKAMETSGCPRDMFDLVSDHRKLILEDNNAGLESMKHSMCATNLDIFIYNDLILFMKHVQITPQADTNRGFYFAGLIYIAGEEKKEETKYELQYENRIHLDSEPFPWIKDCINDPTSFQIVTRKDIFTIYAPNEDKKVEWIKQIVGCLDIIAKQKPHYLNNRAKLQTLDQLKPVSVPSSPKRRPPGSPSLHKRGSSLLDLFTMVRKTQEDEVLFLDLDSIDHSQFPPRDTSLSQLKVRTKKELSTVKLTEDMVIQATSTFTDDNNQRLTDELLFNKGDILLVYEKLNDDYWIVKKLGLSCNVERKRQLIESSIPRDYHELKTLMMQEPISPLLEEDSVNKKILRSLDNHFIQIDDVSIMEKKEKELTFDTSVIQNTSSPAEDPLPRTTSWSSFFTAMKTDQDSMLIQNLINISNESGHIGVVPAKFFVPIQSMNVVKKIQKLVNWRNGIEERKKTSLKRKSIK